LQTTFGRAAQGSRMGIVATQSRTPGRRGVGTTPGGRLRLAAQRREAGGNPGLSRNCDRGLAPGVRNLLCTEDETRGRRNGHAAALVPAGRPPAPLIDLAVSRAREGGGVGAPRRRPRYAAVDRQRAGAGVVRTPR